LIEEAHARCRMRRHHEGPVNGVARPKPHRMRSNSSRVQITHQDRFRDR
jgi:hypothetical protein